MMLQMLHKMKLHPVFLYIGAIGAWCLHQTLSKLQDKHQMKKLFYSKCKMISMSTNV